MHSELHLPRILCLHGGGTNARIFKLQCRMLERALRPTFRLVYAEAPFEVMTPGSDVSSVYEKYGPFKAWLPVGEGDEYMCHEERLKRIDGALAAAMCADDLLRATGKWVAILGFSQRAKLAASILYRQQTNVGRQECHFGFGVIMAGRGPLVWLRSSLSVTPRGMVDTTALSTLISHSEPPAQLLRLPTIHVRGLRDPNIESYQALQDRFCESESVRVMEWQGSHRVPIKSEDVRKLANAIAEMKMRVASGALCQEHLAAPPHCCCCCWRC